ncbi:unnamed protein product [Parnassius mnemosyne]|uniref:Uncharacterized protein n=1 Tax=Parnassius mnemosyne TaxID=213953 RepID=A0AAV1L3E0_9NEOP
MKSSLCFLHQWTGFVFVTPGHHGGYQQGYHPSQRTYEQPNLEDQNVEQGSGKEEKPKGFLGMLKNMFGRRKKEKSESDVSMIGEVPSEDMQETEVYKTENSFGFNMPSGTIQNLFHNSHIVHPDNWKEKSLDKTQRLDVEVGQEILPRLGYHGKNKYKYAFHEPWNPLDRLTLLAQAEKDESQYSDEVVATDKTDNEMG